jgi:hypothetical protein
MAGGYLLSGRRSLDCLAVATRLIAVNDLRPARACSAGGITLGGAVIGFLGGLRLTARQRGDIRETLNAEFQRQATAPTRQPLPRQDLHVGAPQAPARPQTSMRCVVNGALAGHEGIPQPRERCDPHRRPSAPLARRAHNDCASAARSRGSRLQSRQSRRRLGAVLLLATTSGGALLTVLLEGHRYQPAYAMSAGRGCRRHRLLRRLDCRWWGAGLAGRHSDTLACARWGDCAAARRNLDRCRACLSAEPA